MTRSDWTFGAPVTEPGGKVARSSSALPTPGRSRPCDAGDQVPETRVGFGVGRRGARTVP